TSTPGNAAPGWYPDASGTQRWWDGQGWTAHTAAPTAAAAPFERPQLPADARLDTAWTWAVAVVTFIAAIPVFFWDFTGYFHAIIALETGDASGFGPALGTFFGYYAIIMVVSAATYAFAVVSAFRDYKHLVSVGVVRPFHWAF